MIPHETENPQGVTARGYGRAQGAEHDKLPPPMGKINALIGPNGCREIDAKELFFAL